MRDQARIVHGDACRMVRKSPALKLNCVVQKNLISVPATESTFIPVGKDSEVLDGLNVSMAILDELHAHKDGGMFDIMDTATGAREQPVILMITTAGRSRASFGFRMHELCKRILLDPKSRLENYFVFIATLDEGDDWHDENVWIKANPNLGISVDSKYLRDKVAKADAEPGASFEILTKHFNIWVKQANRWIDPNRWAACGRQYTWDDLKGLDCTAGLDLAFRFDLAALVLQFADEAGRQLLWPFFWIPEEAAETRERADCVEYRVWQQQGFINFTEGNVTDFEVIQEAIKAISEEVNIRRIAIDRWNAHQMAIHLQKHGLEVMEFTQSPTN